MMPRKRNKKVPTRLNPYTGKRERVTRNPLASIRLDPRRPMRLPGQGIINVPGMRKKRSTPGAPYPFSYGWESVYKRRGK